MSFNFIQSEAINESMILLWFWTIIMSSEDFAIGKSGPGWGRRRRGRLVVDVSTLNVGIGYHCLPGLLLVGNLRGRILPIGFLPLRRRLSRTSRELTLLHCLPMTLLQSLHLLLFFMTTMNSLTDRATYRTTYILATMVVTEHIPRTDTMRNHTFLIFTFRNMFPQPLHSSTMWCHGALIILMRALSRMSQQ